jgi:hypothetical protein
MNKGSKVLFVTLIFLLGNTAYAYGDPTGGSLFQILLPTLAALWASWLIFANRVRTALTNLYRRLRTNESKDPIS